MATPALPDPAHGRALHASARANGAPSAPAQSEIDVASPPLGQGVSLLSGFPQSRLGPHAPRRVPVTPLPVPAGSAGPGLLVCERAPALRAPQPQPRVTLPLPGAPEPRAAADLQWCRRTVQPNPRLQSGQWLASESPGPRSSSLSLCWNSRASDFCQRASLSL